MNRFGLGSSQVGRLIDKDHATALNSNKVVRDMLYTKNDNYVDEIVKWAEVFDDVIPDGNLSNIIIQQRVMMLLDSLTDDRYAMIQALEELTKKIKGDATDL